MGKVTVSTSSKQYDVHIGSQVISELLSFIKNELPGCTKILLLTDETVKKLHLKTILNALGDANIVTYTVPSGEKAKTFEKYDDCLTFALEEKLDRKSLLLAFGGGAVGDLGGFVAATFMRGIPFIQIPTTILAHDSAVGGKVAINHPQGKNMIGAFYQPEAVFYDLSFLQTLPIHEVRSGFAEVIKHALIHNEFFLHQLMSEVTSLDDLSLDTLQFALTEGIKIKSNIVGEDEKEVGVRAFLNFGHTLGHAIEAESGYGVVTHGEAVLIGMVFALELSKEKLGLSFDQQAFTSWVKELGYEVTLSNHLSPENLLSRMQQDKKTIGRQVRFVLLENIGAPRIVKLDDDYLIEKLTQFSQGG